MIVNKVLKTFENLTPSLYRVKICVIHKYIRYVKYIIRLFLMFISVEGAMNKKQAFNQHGETCP